MISHIHHINFLVEDLEQSIVRYEALFGCNAFEIEVLGQRAVKTARTKLGETWFVLVQPTDNDSIPAQHLKKHGEGFFLLSLGTDDLDHAKTQLETLLDQPFSTPERSGLENWRVIDIRPELFLNTQLQLTQDRGETKHSHI